MAGVATTVAGSSVNTSIQRGSLYFRVVMLGTEPVSVPVGRYYVSYYIYSNISRGKLTAKRNLF